MPKGFVIAGVALFSAAGVILLLASGLPWQPHLDFDVVGILWLLQNVPKLAALLSALPFIAGGLYCFGRALGWSWMTRHTMQEPRGEEARMLADPRFHTPRKKP
jgi:hypothetical protein